jgi:hypothetical protein
MITSLADASTWAQEAETVGVLLGQGNYFYYSRSDNPNYLLLEKELTRLHHGRRSLLIF